MRVALYARVSSDRQEKQRSIGSQIDTLQARAVAEGWTVAQHGIDDGYSGATWTDPAWTRSATPPPPGSSTPSSPCAPTGSPATSSTRPWCSTNWRVSACR